MGIDHKSSMAETGDLLDCEGYCEHCGEVKDTAEFAYPHLCQDCYEARLQREEVALEDMDNYPDGIDEEYTAEHGDYNPPWRR